MGVGLLDTGVDPRHPALRGRVDAFLYVDEEGRAEPERSAFDDDGHGTHIAALICSGAAGDRATGAASSAARLHCAAVLDEGSVPVRLLVGVHWLLQQPIRVLVLPLGIPARTPLLRDVLRRVRRRGILPICAVGNGGSGRADTPGGDPEVLSVGACDARGEPASFSGSLCAPRSDRCLKPDVLAPGVDVRSARPGRGWQRRSGTSMACAVVARLAARLFEAAPEATPSQVEAAIVRSARMPAPGFAHRSRTGIIEPTQALRRLRRGDGLRRPAAAGFPGDDGSRCDPLLRRQIQLRLTDVLEAIVMLEPTRRRHAERLEAVVRRSARASRRRYTLRVLPDGRTGVVRAHVHLIKRLLVDPEVAYLHSTELDGTGWSPRGG